MLINHIRTNSYFDSVSLMVLSAQLSKGEDIILASVMMGTPSNKQVMQDAGLLLPEGATATAQDMITAVKAANEQALDWATAQINSFLNRDATTLSGGELNPYRPKGLDTALKHAPDSNLVSISLAGEHASWEAEKAIAHGLHVFLFSDNIDLPTELRLKQKAVNQGLLLMGPDCGTTVINGVGLGFSNKVRRGSIGLIGASGTGLQEVMCQIHHQGGGVSHAIGIGGRDLHPQIGGIMADLAYRTLYEDPSTSTIVIVSKPAKIEVIVTLLESWSEYSEKPTLLCLVGSTDEERSLILDHMNRKKYKLPLYWATTLMEAGKLAVQLNQPNHNELIDETNAAIQLSAATSDLSNIVVLQPQQQYMHGFYCGGTLCYEAAVLLSGHSTTISSNVHYSNVEPLDNKLAHGHVLIDYGSDEFTLGTPHPMIFPDIRNKAISQVGHRTDVGVVLFDVILGYGAHSEPCLSIIEAIEQARQTAAHHSIQHIYVAALCGTDEDSQHAGEQASLLTQAGVHVFNGHAAAVQFAKELLRAVKENQS